MKQTTTTTSLRRRTFLAALVLGAACTSPAFAHSPPVAPPYVKARLVQVDVYDRFDGTALPVYGKDGRHYIVGVPGHEYAVRIRNCTGGRVLAVTSVDGVNVISGDTANPGQSGYVLEPWGSVEITGWRKSMERTAAFYFTDLGDSYAARTGRPLNVGVIGVAVFQERPRRVSWRDAEITRKSENDWPSTQPAERKADARGDLPASPPEPMAAPRAQGPDTAASAEGRARQESAAKDAAGLGQSFGSTARPAAKIGTGHGRSEDSRVTTVQFERATTAPAETVAIQYDRRENLAALGVLPVPYYAQRQPDPFPGMRFAPDPTR